MAKKFLTNIDLSKNQILQPVIEVLASAPGTPAEGQIYYNSTDETIYLRQNAAWLDLGQQGISDGDYGDITVSGTGSTFTIDNNVVTLAKIQDIATASFIGRTTAGSGDPEVLSSTQATDLLNLFDTASTTKGLVPGSNGATSQFLRGDGTWASPAGGFAGFDFGDGTGFQSVNDGDLVDITGGTGLTAAVSKVSTTVTLNIDLDNTAVTPGSYGNASTVSTFTVDQQGRLTAAGATTISITESQISDLGTYLENIVEDTTPELGGNLVTNGNDIVLDNTSEITSVSGEAINIEPAGNGALNLGTNTTGDVEIGTDSSSIFIGAQAATLIRIGDNTSAAHATNIYGATVTIVSGGDTTTFNSNGITTTELGFASGARITTILDEDSMASDSATALATQQSIKAYVDNAILGGTKVVDGYNAATNTPDLTTSPSGINEGDTYYVTVAGTFFTEDVQIGDALIAKQDDPTILDHWIRINKNIPDIENASTTASGIVELATVAETNAGTDDTRAVTPDGLDGWTGSAQITTLGTIGTGVWQGSVIAEAYLPNASTTAQGVVELATSAEVDTGTATNLAITPDALANSIYGTPIQRYTQQIGNGALTSFTINHAIGRQFVTVQVFETATPYAQVECDIELDDANNCGINFNTAPGTNEFTVVVVG